MLGWVLKVSLMFLSIQVLYSTAILFIQTKTMVILFNLCYNTSVKCNISPIPSSFSSSEGTVCLPWKSCSKLKSANEANVSTWSVRKEVLSNNQVKMFISNWNPDLTKSVHCCTTLQIKFRFIYVFISNLKVTSLPFLDTRLANTVGVPNLLTWIFFDLTDKQKLYYIFTKLNLQSLICVLTFIVGVRMLKVECWWKLQSQHVENPIVLLNASIPLNILLVEIEIDIPLL